jgi:hypothetical protein
VTTATCAAHPDREAAGACERCGTFACSACLSLVGLERLCPACRARLGDALPSLTGRGRLAMPFVWATGVLGVLVSLGTLAVPQSASEEDVGGVALATGCLALVYLGVFVVSIVLFCRWFHLLVRHAKARGQPLDVSPAAAVGSFFIPFVNLVRPYAIAKQIAQGEGVQLVTAWQAAWLGGNIISNVGNRMQSSATSQAGVVVDLIGSLVILGAAWACGRVVSELTRTTQLTPPSSAPAGLPPPLPGADR